tara:strand:+ start:258 stop:725 length:468 start_codon:yes stop_codon:yes gene_type:complete
MTKYLTFNHLEWKIFDHRWSLLHDCIVDCLTETFGDWPEDWEDQLTLIGKKFNKVTKKESFCTSKLNRNEVVRFDITNLNLYDKEVLEDVVSGNTWFADYEEIKWGFNEWKKTGDTIWYDPSTYGKETPSDHLKAGRSIERKLKKLGIEVKFPLF